MHTEVHNAVTAADQGTQYDESAKRLLGQKSILAQILVRTVDEFKGMNPRYVETLIEGEPYISRIPLEPGLTNQEVMKAAVELKAAGEAKQNLGRKVKAKSGQRITGLNTENQEHAEGLVRFDIVFYVRMKDGLSQIIINVEAQKDEPQRYGILNRAVFYVSRLISSQKERDFENTEYDDIKRVYSIWVCMNMEENSLSHIHLVKDDLVGYHDWRGKLDLFNIVMIGLAKELPGQGEQYELHRLLGALLSKELTIDEKLNINGFTVEQIALLELLGIIRRLRALYGHRDAVLPIGFRSLFLLGRRSFLHLLVLGGVLLRLRSSTGTQRQYQRQSQQSCKSSLFHVFLLTSHGISRRSAAV